MKWFDFIFILHMMKENIGITNIFCQTLQQQFQDVVNVMNLICTTKNLIQELRESGWDELFTSIKSFSKNHDIVIPDLNDVHLITSYDSSRLKDNQKTIEHYFRVEIFFTIIDK